MKTRKPATPSRRGFLARLAAVGTMLGGVVPELRAGTLMETPIAPPPATPLPPAASALLYSSALADAEVKMLLASAGPGANAMPPEHTYDLGGQGQGIALPVKNSSGIVTAYVFYGKQIGSPAIKLFLKDDGTATVALNNKIYPTPTEASEKVEILYASFFTTKFIETQVEKEVNRYKLQQGKQGQPVSLIPHAAIKKCVTQFEACMWALVAKVGIAPGTPGDLVITGCITCMVASLVVMPGLATTCAAGCALSAMLVPGWGSRQGEMPRRICKVPGRHNLENLTIVEKQLVSKYKQAIFELSLALNNTSRKKNNASSRRLT